LLWGPRDPKLVHDLEKDEKFCIKIVFNDILSLMQKKSPWFLIFFALFLVIPLARVDSSAFTDFLFQSNRVASPRLPWHQPRPTEPAVFLSPNYTPFRPAWQPPPRVTEIRPHSLFEITDYERWRNLNLRGFPLIDAELREDREFCQIQDSIIGVDSLPQSEINGRCCVCDTGGKWVCERNSSSNAPCNRADLLFSGIEITRDTGFSTNDTERIQFTGTLRNGGAKVSNNVQIQIFVNDVLQTERILDPIEANEQLSFSQIDFPGIANGIVLNAGNNEIRFVAENLRDDESDLENNQYIEIVSVIAPHIDFELVQAQLTNGGNTIGQFQLQNTVVINTVVSAQTVGSYTGPSPTSYTVNVQTSASFDPVYTETYPFNEIGEVLSESGLINILPGEYDFTVSITTDVDASNPEPTDNNSVQFPFIVD